jgi:hypothetical protein
MATMQSARPVLQPLPSKLPAAEVVSSGTHTLAADSAGTLFLSRDAGRHWKPVAAQWPGKVTRLRLTPAAAQQGGLEQLDRDQSSASAAANTAADTIQLPSAAPAAAKSPAPVMVFQLVTDSGAVWVSSDGLLWKPAP